MPGGAEIVAVAADGTSPVVITPRPIPQVQFFAWAPDSLGVIASSTGTDRVRYDVTGATPPLEVASAISRGGNDFNLGEGNLYRPPSGSELIRLTFADGGPALVTTKSDGSEPRTIFSTSTAPFPYDELTPPAWSPDGTMLTFAVNVDSADAASVPT